MHERLNDHWTLPESVRTSPYRLEIDVAIRTARGAGALLKKRWNQPIKVHHKGQVDLVSEADLEAEKFVIGALQSHFPSDGIVAEEEGDVGGGHARTWHIDPLDGTTNFTHGFPTVATSIALTAAGAPLVGVVYEPLRDWSFTRQNGGAYLNGKKLSVSQCKTLEHALLATGFPYDRWTKADNNSATFCHFLRRCQGMRRAGAAALDLAFVAAGWLDGCWEKSLSSWDIAAGILLVAEAGGCVTTTVM